MEFNKWWMGKLPRRTRRDDESKLSQGLMICRKSGREGGRGRGEAASQQWNGHRGTTTRRGAQRGGLNVEEATSYCRRPLLLLPLLLLGVCSEWCGRQWDDVWMVGWVVGGRRKRRRTKERANERWCGMNTLQTLGCVCFGKWKLPSFLLLLLLLLLVVVVLFLWRTESCAHFFLSRLLLLCEAIQVQRPNGARTWFSTTRGYGLTSSSPSVWEKGPWKWLLLIILEGCGTMVEVLSSEWGFKLNQMELKEW